MQSESCGNCKFWDARNSDEEDVWGDGSGSCRRYPPTLDLSQQKKWEENQGGIEGYTYLDYRFWNFPVTEIYLWCGEWVLRSNPSGKGRPTCGRPLDQRVRPGGRCPGPDKHHKPTATRWAL